MRPVDLLLGAPHAFFDATFDNLTGAPMLVLEDYTWAAAGNAPAPALYVYVRNGQLWGGNTEPAQPAQIAWNGTDHLLNATVVPPRNLVPVNRNNTGPLFFNPRALCVQLDKGTGAHQQRWLRIRLAAPAVEASDLVRAWEDGNWNGAAPATIPAGRKDEIRNKIFQTGTVPEDPDRAGTYYGYRGAIKDLEAAVGGYCSYCEAKRQDGPTLDVEHRIAKAFYASEILLWENFLLGCDVCNQRFKRDQPTRSFGIANALAAYHPGAAVAFAGGNVSPNIPPGGNPLPYWEMRQACNEYQAWPSLDDGGAGPPIPAANPANPTNYSLLCYHYRLREYPAVGGPVWVPPADSINLDNSAIGDGPNKTVQANVYDSGIAAMRVMNVRVEVEARSPNTGNVAFDNRKQTAAGSTINMVGLNQVPNAYGDRRMLQRTYAWFTAIENLRLLRQQLAALNSWQNSWIWRRVFNAPPSPDFTNDQWNLVASAAEGGYYSVWLTVFKAFSVANQIGNNNLVANLANRLNLRAAGNVRFRYMGTNLANSVTNLLPNL
jgi:hypothetical protein